MFFIGVSASGYEKEMRTAFWLYAKSVLGAFVVRGLLGWLVARGICRPVNKAVDHLAESIDEVSGASACIDEACRQLA